MSQAGCMGMYDFLLLALINFSIETLGKSYIPIHPLPLPTRIMR